MQAFNMLVLKISLGLPSILYSTYNKWTFQGKRQLVVGSLLFTGLSIIDNGYQGEHITL